MQLNLESPNVYGEDVFRVRYDAYVYRLPVCG